MRKQGNLRSWLKNITKREWLLGIFVGLFFASALVLGGLMTVYGKPLPPVFNLVESTAARENFGAEISKFEENAQQLATAAVSLKNGVAKEKAAQIAQNKTLAELAAKSKKNKNLSIATYEKMIVNRLGNATVSLNGKNSEIMIFPLEKADFRGYMAKVRLKTTNALRVTVAPEAKKSGETTLAAVKRLGGILGVNGGGFATQTTNGVSRLVPMGNTMIKGKLVGDFQPAANDFAFAGFSKSGKLVGGSYQTEKALLKSGAWQGVSFVPALIRDWEPTKIPAKWSKSRQPRTVLGQYPNGDLFFIVVDGRQSNWSNGITLEEMQILLLKLGVMEAFNLDGGGSSAFVYDGTVKNKPSDGAARKLATNIVIMK